MFKTGLLERVIFQITGKTLLYNTDNFSKYQPPHVKSASNNFLTIVNKRTKKYEAPFFPTHPDQARLFQIKQQIEPILARHPYGRTKIIVENLLHDTKDQLSKSIPNSNEVARIGREFEFHLEKPTWWNDVFICYKYATDRKGKFCDGEPFSCASTNNFTKYYHKKPRNGKGCNITWGLFYYGQEKRSLPDWFRNIQLCFRNTQRCGRSDKPSVQCAQLNEFLPYYQDAANKPGCSVRFSWSLRVTRHIYPHQVSDSPRVSDGRKTITGSVTGSSDWSVYNHSGQSESKDSGSAVTSNYGSVPAWALNLKLCVRYQQRWRELWISSVSSLITKCSLTDYFEIELSDRSYYRGHFDKAESIMKWSIENTI